MNEPGFTIPLITSMGQFEEVRLLYKEPVHWRYKYGTIYSEGEALTITEVFNLRRFSYWPGGKQQADVDVYVSRELFDEMEDAHMREYEIQKFVAKHAAWLFTYGERKVIG